MDTAKRVVPTITFVYCFGLQNLRRHMCCRAITNKYRGRHTFISVHNGYLLDLISYLHLFLTLRLHIYVGLVILACVS